MVTPSTSSFLSSQHCCDTTNVVATTVISTVTSSYATSILTPSSSFPTPSSSFLTPSNTYSSFPTPSSSFLTPSNTYSSFPTPSSSFLTPSNTYSSFPTPSSSFPTPSDTYSSFLTPFNTYSTAVVYKASESPLLTVKTSELDESMPSTSTSRVIVNPNVSTGPSITTSMEENDTIIFASVAPVLLILFIAIAISTIILLLFMIWRRKKYTSFQIDKHGEVELRQKDCYADSKQQQYVCSVYYYIHVSMYLDFTELSMLKLIKNKRL